MKKNVFNTKNYLKRLQKFCMCYKLIFKKAESPLMIQSYQLRDLDVLTPFHYFFFFQFLSFIQENIIFYCKN